MLKKLIVSAVLFGALQAQAVVTLYTGEATYLAAVGATTTYVDFAGTPATTVSGASFTSAVTFGSCPTGLASCGTQVFHNSNAITDLGGSPAPNGVAAVGGSFAAAVIRLCVSLCERRHSIDGLWRRTGHVGHVVRRRIHRRRIRYAAEQLYR